MSLQSQTIYRVRKNTVYAKETEEKRKIKAIVRKIENPTIKAKKH